MTVAAFAPYIVTIHVVTTPERALAAADKLARYIIDRWMPGNAGGVHVLMTPKLAKRIAGFYAHCALKKKEMQVRVSLDNGLLLTVIEQP